MPLNTQYKLQQLMTEQALVDYSATFERGIGSGLDMFKMLGKPAKARKTEPAPPDPSEPSYPNLEAIGFVFPGQIDHGVLVRPSCPTCGSKRAVCPSNMRSER